MISEIILFLIVIFILNNLKNMIVLWIKLKNISYIDNYTWKIIKRLEYINELQR
jgi:hypothetical protein